MASEVTSSHRRENSKAMRSLLSSLHDEKHDKEGVEVSSWGLADLEQLITGTRPEPRRRKKPWRGRRRRQRASTSTTNDERLLEGNDDTFIHTDDGQQRLASGLVSVPVPVPGESRNKEHRGRGGTSIGRGGGSRSRGGRGHGHWHGHRCATATANAPDPSPATCTPSPTSDLLWIQDRIPTGKQKHKVKSPSKTKKTKDGKTTQRTTTSNNMNKTIGILTGTMPAPAILKSELSTPPSSSLSDLVHLKRRHSVTLLSRWSNGAGAVSRTGTATGCDNMVPVPRKTTDDDERDYEYPSTSLTRRRSIASTAPSRRAGSKNTTQRDDRPSISSPDTTVATVDTTSSLSALTYLSSMSMSASSTFATNRDSDNIQEYTKQRSHEEDQRTTTRSVKAKRPHDTGKRNKTFAAWRDSLQRVAQLPLTGEPSYNCLPESVNEVKQRKTRKKMASRPTLRRQDSTIVKRPSSDSSMDMAAVLADFDTALRRTSRPPLQRETRRQFPGNPKNLDTNHVTAPVVLIQPLQRRAMSCSPATSKRGVVSGFHNFSRRASMTSAARAPQPLYLHASSSSWNLETPALSTTSDGSCCASMASLQQIHNNSNSPCAANVVSAISLSNRRSIVATARGNQNESNTCLGNDSLSTRESLYRRSNTAATAQRNVKESTPPLFDGSAVFTDSPLDRRSSNIATSQRNQHDSATSLTDGIVSTGSPLYRRSSIATTGISLTDGIVSTDSPSCRRSSRIATSQGNQNDSATSLTDGIVSAGSPLYRRSNSIATSQRNQNESAISSPLYRRSSIAAAQGENYESVNDCTVHGKLFPRASIPTAQRYHSETAMCTDKSLASPSKRQPSKNISSPHPRQLNPRIVAQRLDHETNTSPIRKRVLTKARTTPTLIIF